MTPSEAPLLADKKVIRQAMRRKRRSLSPFQQKAAAAGLASILKKSDLFKRCRHVAIYLANDGEIDPSLFIKALWRCNKRCYLPVLHPTKKNTLWFLPYHENTSLKANRFGILEPKIQNQDAIPPWALDLVLFPLVAFDNKGRRLGMGGGFYDRTFEFTRKGKARKATERTKLYGLAHNFQEVDVLSSEDWDIPLHGVATENKLHQVFNPM